MSRVIQIDKVDGVGIQSPDLTNSVEKTIAVQNILFEAYQTVQGKSNSWYLSAMEIVNGALTLTRSLAWSKVISFGDESP